jgi:hypothetical protein
MAEPPSGYVAADDGISISGVEFRMLSGYRKLPRDLQRCVSELIEHMRAALPRDKKEEGP